LLFCFDPGERNLVSPIKRSSVKGKTSPIQEKILFFLAEVERGVSNSRVQSHFAVAVVSLDLVVSDFFTAPVTHQDLG
jgi:hypothetical protein